MEQRLIELETRLAFQDEALQTLNTVVIRQQQEIAVLIEEIAALKRQIQSLTPDLMTGQTPETPPPHY